MQPQVRQSAVSFLGALRLFVGPTLISLFDDEKPALVTIIKDKFTEVGYIARLFSYSFLCFFFGLSKKNEL
jgi:hypothetical protein